MPRRPQSSEGVPSLPLDLGDLSDHSLMTLFNELTAWSNYIAMQVAKAEVDEDEAEARLKTLSAKYMVKNTDKGDKVTIVRAERDTDPDVVEAEQEVIRRKALRKMVSTLMQNTERSTFAVSRELTRRVGLAGPSGRTHRTGA